MNTLRRLVLPQAPSPIITNFLVVSDQHAAQRRRQALHKRKENANTASNCILDSKDGMRNDIDQRMRKLYESR